MFITASYGNNLIMKNILLFLSAFIPMYILILIKEVVELINKNIDVNVLNIVVIVFLLLVIILGVVGLLLEIYNKRQRTIEIIIVTKNNITDQHFLGYFSLFVLFAITFDLTKICMFVVFVLILVMIGVVYVKNKLFYINPFLNILGYNFYDITYRLNSCDEVKSTHIFYKGELVLHNKYKVKIKDENFSFIAK